MNNLFSIFDPSTGLLSLNWLSVIIITMIPSAFWLSSNKILISYYKVLGFVLYEMKTLLNMNYPNSTGVIMTSLFSTIMLMNILGLTPYVFTPSSHLSITMSLALPMWTGYVVWGLFFSSSKFLAHLVPKGTPSPLVPLMVLIELTSTIIRPATLSVRLAANMVAGHLLLVLMSSPLPQVSWLIIPLGMGSLMLLSALELGVSVIQAYVFAALSSMYIEENKIPN